MNKDAKILIIDDNEDILFAAKQLFKPLVREIKTLNDPKAIPQLLKTESYDVIFLDMNFTEEMTSGSEGIYWLKEILNVDPLAVVVLITAYGDVETAVKAVKLGATDFVLKPWQNEKLVTTFSAALKLRQSRVELETTRQQKNQLKNDMNSMFPNMIGISKRITKVFDTISKVAKTDANVLILGENGTGKELVARAIHNNSLRFEEIFLGVDLGAISKTLFESELFGHIKGAFTDARESRSGRFEIANKGTLFLDEIGNLELDMQTKLLSAIERREVTRVGDNNTRAFDIRLICATNKDLDELVAKELFRQDLLYRINTVVIQIPPLRERIEDIPLLAEFYFNIFKKKYGKSELSITKEALNKLADFNWPGNVRELKHTIERAIILSDSNKLLPEDILVSQQTQNKNLFDGYNLESIEKNVIEKVLKNNEGNQSKAATDLGITRTSLYRRMKKYNL